MNWRPGSPVVTAQDRSEWHAWRNDQKRQQQRERRAVNPRIDYYPDAAAAQAIRALVGEGFGGDLSSVINRIVGEWSDASPPE